MVDASTGSLLDAIRAIEAALAAGADTVEVLALDPDLAVGHYAGERIEIAGTPQVHRPLSLWFELAEKLGLRLRIPTRVDPPRVRLVFARRAANPARPAPVAATEKYGAASAFARVSKLDDPRFVLDLREALARIALPATPTILDLGMNRGDELALLFALVPRLVDTATVVGIDHCASALMVARARFAAHAGVHCVEADVAALAATMLPVARFDLILSIDTLHSPGIDDRALLRHLVLDRLAPGGSVILGFPNCRYTDGELEYGTRVKNLREPELGHLIKDVAFFRRYLQQHRLRVFVTGKHEVLLTAIPDGDARPAPGPRARLGSSPTARGEVSARRRP